MPNRTTILFTVIDVSVWRLTTKRFQFFHTNRVSSVQCRLIYAYECKRSLYTYIIWPVKPWNKVLTRRWSERSRYARQLAQYNNINVYGWKFYFWPTRCPLATRTGWNKYSRDVITAMHNSAMTALQRWQIYVYNIMYNAVVRDTGNGRILELDFWIT